MRPKLHLISLGCTKNLVDSEVMLGRLRLCEMTSRVEEADIIIINTCGFIHAAKQESIQTILQTATDRKDGAILVVSGCLSERYASELESEIPEIDIIIGVRDYAKIDMLLEQRGFFLPKFAPTHSPHSPLNPQVTPNPHITRNPLPSSPQLSRLDSTISTTQSRILASTDKVFLADENDFRIISGSRLHAYIKLSEGCNQQCSFCAIPHFKGKLQSRGIDSILREVEQLAARGFVDFSFIAQDSSSYLRDQGKKDGLITLIRELDKQNIAKNARIHYLYPTSTSHKLIETIINSPIVQNYFDMPIQHIADSMLTRMRRHHSQAQVKEQLELMRAAPNAFIRSTFIVGHPGESEAEFDELCAFLASGVFDRVNLFAFSSEEGTLAHTMPHHITTKITNARLKKLQKILQAQKSFAKLINTTTQAFIESKSAASEYFYSARDRRWGIEIDGEILINDMSAMLQDTTQGVLEAGLYEVHITQAKDSTLIGTATQRLW